MSFIYRDSVLPSRMKWNAMSSAYHKFRKMWFHDGGIYITGRHFYWKDSFIEDVPLKRFLNAIRGVGRVYI